MNIVFMGTPEYARVILEKLVCNHYISALFCQPDRRAGRNMKLLAPETKEFVLKYNETTNRKIPIYQPDNFDDDIMESIRNTKCDAIVVAAFGRILPKAVLEIAPCINLHASILPKYRGASPIQSAILNNDKYYGVTSMLMNEGLDSGDVLGYRIIKNSGQNSEQLFKELSEVASVLALQTLERINFIQPVSQNSCSASYCKKIKKEFGEVSFDNSYEIERKSLAYSGWPKVFLRNGLKLISVKSNDVDIANNEGKILEISRDGVLVGCTRGSIWIYKVQAPSKSEVGAYEYIQGKRLKVGDIFC